MIRTARCELNLLISSLEVDYLISGFAKFVTEIFYKVRSWKDDGSLALGREFAVYGNVVKFGRYRPFKLRKDLERSAVSSPGQVKLLHSAEPLKASTCDQNSLPIDVLTDQLESWSSLQISN